VHPNNGQIDPYRLAAFVLGLLFCFAVWASAIALIIRGCGSVQ
jgi:hypothetical protein